MTTIIIDDTAIWASGSTEADAWHNFQVEMDNANLRQHIDGMDQDATFDRDNFRAVPATQELANAVQERGGQIGYEIGADGIATLAA